MFESLVNLEGCKTQSISGIIRITFESLVNLEGCKTLNETNGYTDEFESLVNLEGCKTSLLLFPLPNGLRVLLI